MFWAVRGLDPARVVYFASVMDERLLILAPDLPQRKRLGDALVGLANALGLVVGGAIAIALIALLTG
jgi:hypothetical protein